MTLVSPDELVQQPASRPPPQHTGPQLYDAAEFTRLGDRLVRNLFDTGLRLDTIRMAFDRDQLTSAELDENRAAIVDILTNLDSMIRTTGLAMLSLTAAAPMGELRSRRRR
ncbi:hypothetical protein AB0M22_20140 [Nocardia sp. NPDC051756]|uniref:hypothetical protein n=1 Tax=Nocardia sp. NPDC051756 TaxID=3154751 RepID=UPI0034395D4A